MQVKKLSGLSVKRVLVNKITMVKACGKCDLFSVQLLKDTMAEVIDEGCGKLIIDVKDVSFGDNSGIAAILWARHKIEEGGGRIVVVGLKKQYGRTQDFLDGLLYSAASMQEALVVLDKGNFSCK